MSVPARFASHYTVFAAGIAEAAAFRTKVNRFDGAYHDKMRHDTLCLDKTAVDCRGRASEHRGAGYELGPFAARESFVEIVTGTAGENIRQRLV
jgi:hypothetical protein